MDRNVKETQAAEATLEEADRVLSRAPLVQEAAAILARDGERPWVVAYPDEGALRRGRFVNVHEAVRFRLETAAVKLPIALRLRGLTIARIPLLRLANGRVDRDRLRRQIGEPPGRIWPASPEGRSPIANGWSAFLGAAAIFRGHAGPPYRELSLEHDLGLDSLDRMALIVSAARAAGVEVTDETITSIYTLGDLVDQLGPAPAHLSRTPLRMEPREVLRGPSHAHVPRRWLRPPRISWPLIRLVRAIMGPRVRRQMQLEITGFDRVDWTLRPLIIAQNHQSHMDAALLAAALPPSVHRQTFFLGFTGYFARGLVGLFAKIFRIYPISADAGALDGLRLGVAAIEAGRILCIFPEGERTWNGSLQRFRRGTSWIARETGAMVVPACIAGAYQAWPRGWSFRAHPVRILFGPAITPPDRGSGDVGDREFAARLRAALSDLMREGGYDPDRGDPRIWSSGPSAGLARGEGGR